MTEFDSRKCVYFVLVSLLMGIALGASDEQWQEDQAAGNYWYVGRGGIYTHDPYDNNPGTMVVIASPEKNEVRIYPDIPFPEGGDADVRYSFGTTPEEAGSSFEAWPVTFEQGVFGYVEVPRELTETFIDGANAEGSVILEITDRQGNIATRTFIFRGYDEAYASLPDSVRILPPPNENGLHTVTFNVLPRNASVVVFREFCFLGCNRREVGRGTGGSFTIELEENNPEANYVYVSSLRDYVQKEKAFDVPQTLSIDVEMNQPRGLLGWLVRRGHMSTEIYGEDWPFIVKEGTLNCLPVEQAVFETSEGTYALNEAAEGEFPVIDMLVAPEVYDDYAAGGIDIAWLTDRALQFCD